MCLGGIWAEGCFTLAFFLGWGVGSEVLLEKVQLNFSFRNKFIIVLPCGILVEYNTFLKMCTFKSLTRYTDDDGYENRNAYVLIIIKSKAMNSLFI